MKENPDTLSTTPSPHSDKRDTSRNLTRYRIWYQDTSQPNLWHSRTGTVIDTALQGDEDFYHDVLEVVQMVFPFEVRPAC